MSQNWRGWPSYSDYLEARSRYATLTPKLFDGKLVGFTIDLPGVVGNGSKAKITYKVWITLINSPQLHPEAWITSPSDLEIKHRNIYHVNGGRPHVRLPLPFMCLGSFGQNWDSGNLGRATNILSFIDQVYNVLNNENPSSPAR